MLICKRVSERGRRKSIVLKVKVGRDGLRFRERSDSAGEEEGKRSANEKRTEKERARRRGKKKATRLTQNNRSEGEEVSTPLRAKRRADEVKRQSERKQGEPSWRPEKREGEEREGERESQHVSRRPRRQ